MRVRCKWDICYKFNSGLYLTRSDIFVRIRYFNLVESVVRQTVQRSNGVSFLFFFSCFLILLLTNIFAWTIFEFLRNEIVMFIFPGISLSLKVHQLDRVMLRFNRFLSLPAYYRVIPLTGNDNSRRKSWSKVKWWK